MAETKIEWCDHTFNPWIGCAKVSAGCANCYAEAYADRWGTAVWGDGPSSTRKVTSDFNWRKPLAWNRKAKPFATNPPRVFCASLADVFEDRVELHEPRERLWKLIDATPNLAWLLLTKRPENILNMVPNDYLGKAVPYSVQYGTTVESQDHAGRISALQGAKFRMWGAAWADFVSAEPLLGALTLDSNEIGHVIIGGESGPKARPMELEWARSLIGRCREEGIPVFMKQLGTWQAKRMGLKHPKGGDMSEWPEDLRVREQPDA